MSYRTAIVLAATAGLLVPLGGTAMANPHEDNEDGWYKNEYTYRYAKGEACSGRVVEHYTSKERVLVGDEDGDLQPLSPEEAETFDPGTLDVGDRWAVETKRGRVHWYAPKTGRHVKRDSSGDFYFRVVGDGNDWRFKGVGNNFYVGVGVKGILNTSGVQKGLIEDFDNGTGGVLSHFRVRGHKEQICTRLHLRPIDNRVQDDDHHHHGGHAMSERRHHAR